MLGNQEVGKQVARRVEGAIKVNLLSTILLLHLPIHHLCFTLGWYSLLHPHFHRCHGHKWNQRKQETFDENQDFIDL